MPTIKVDWVRGNQLVEEQRQKLIARHVPPVILASHQSLVDKTAYVQIWFPEFANQYVFCVIEPHQSFVIECSDPSNESYLSQAANKVASVLDYKVSITKVDPFEKKK
jgi:hypothetical protein